MKTELDHLPLPKREQLAAITALLRENAPVDMIILFGSYARGNWVDDVETGYFSDFDLLLVVATEALANDVSLWANLTNQARLLGGRALTNLIVHDIHDLDREIRVGQYFFSDIIKEGILLYDSKRFKLARVRAQTPSERLATGRYNFEYWFQSASEFWRGACYYAARGLGPHAAFLLHQATERYFHAVLLVFTAYKPRTHDILKLAEQTAPMHPALSNALPRTEPEDDRLFDLLKRAYIDARYSKSYRITPDEFSILRDRVLDLAERVRRACAEKLATITADGEVGELSAVPSQDDAIELPNLPDLEDPKAVELWRDALVQMSYERGESSGRQVGWQEGREEGLRQGELLGRRDGLREGEQIGRREGEARERARAILDVLQRRGVALTDAQASLVVACRNESTLEKWRELAWSVSSADELWRP